MSTHGNYYGSNIREIRKAVMKGNRPELALDRQVRERMFKILEGIAKHNVEIGYGGVLSGGRRGKKKSSKYMMRSRKRSSRRMRSRKRSSMGGCGYGGVGSGGVRSGGRRRMRSRKRSAKRSGKRRMNPWLAHVMAFRKKHPNLTYSEVLKQARKTYKG